MKKIYLLTIALATGTLAPFPAEAGLLDKIKNLMGGEKGEKQENLETLKKVEEAIKRLGIEYNKIMKNNQIINAESQAQLDTYHRYTLEVKDKMNALSLELTKQSLEEIKRIENEIKADQAKMKSLSPPEVASLQQEQQQGLAAKTFWYAMTPLTGVYGMAASALTGAANLAKGVVGMQTPEQIKTELEQSIKKSQETIKELEKFIDNPQNASYVASHPKMQEVVKEIQTLYEKLQGAKAQLDSYWSALKEKSVTQDTKAEYEIKKLQLEVDKHVKSICSLPSWTAAVDIKTPTTSGGGYAYVPSAAFLACKKKYE